MVTHNPLHGSGQAGLPHPALTSGDNSQAAQGIRMTRAGGRQPAVDQAPHPVPEHSGFLTVRAAPHDSGSIGVANPLPYDFFIHYTSPVLTGAQGVRK